MERAAGAAVGPLSDDHAAWDFFVDIGGSTQKLGFDPYLILGVWAFPPTNPSARNDRTREQRRLGCPCCVRTGGVQ